MSPFPQVETFVAVCAKRYRLDLEAVEGGMKDALQTYLEAHNTIKAVLVGTRRNDPHGGKISRESPYASMSG
jgi:FAD synthetase